MGQYTELGRALKRARLAQDMAQTDVARAARLSVGYYGNVERGNRCPGHGPLARLAAALNVEYGDLARLAGHAPQPSGQYTVTVEDQETAAWLRLLGARFTADGLERLYEFGLQWLPGLEAEEETSPSRRRWRRSA